MSNPNTRHVDLLHGLTAQLRRRNAEQTWAFKDVFNSHQGLLTLNEKLRQQTLDQDKDIIILRHKLAEGLSQGETSEALRSMQDELQRLQVQVSDRYRSSAEAASEQLQLMKEAQLLQDQLRRSATSLEKLQAEHGESMARCATLEDQQTVLEAALAAQEAETESLRSLLGGREAEAASLREQAREEREELVTRLLKDKGSMLEEMNKMNEENDMLRAEKKALVIAMNQTQATSPSPNEGLSANKRTLGVDNERLRAGIAPDWLQLPSKAQDQGHGQHAEWNDTSLGRSLPTSPSVSPRAPVVGGGAYVSGSVPSRCFQAIEAHSSSINDIVFEKGGTLLASAGDDSFVKVWDPGSGRQRAVLKGGAHKGFSAMIAVDICGDFVCGGGSDGSCTMWSVRTCREKARLTGHQQKVCAVVFCCSGQRLITGSQDCAIKVWDLHRGFWDVTPTSMRATSKCNAIDVSQTWKDASGVNAVVVSGHMDGTVRLWDMRSGNRAHSLDKLHADQVTSVQFAPGRENLLLTNSRDNSLKVVDARIYRTVAVLRHPHFRIRSNYSRACLSPTAEFAAAASVNGSVFVWNLARASNAAAGSETIGVAAILERHGTAATACHWSTNSPNVLASCDAAGGLRVWG